MLSLAFPSLTGRSRRQNPPDLDKCWLANFHEGPLEILRIQVVEVNQYMRQGSGTLNLTFGSDWNIWLFLCRRNVTTQSQILSGLIDWWVYTDL